MQKALVIITNLKALHFLRLLEEIKLIKFVKIFSSKPYAAAKNVKEKGKRDSFFELKGIWQDRNISIESIREKAWPKRAL